MRSPVPFGTEEKLFRGLHRRFLDRGYPRVPWDALDLGGWSGDEIALARAAWAARTTAEYRSMMVFGEIIARLPELRLPLEVSSSASRLLSDEARHTELCAEMAERLGGHGDTALRDEELRLSRENLSAHLFVARWTASMFCVGESSSVAVLKVLVDGAKNPCVRTVLRILLRDELLHDQFGWALARLVLRGMSDDQAEWLAADLAFAFAHYDRIHGTVEGERPFVPDLGVADRRETARAFNARIERRILPMLAELGVPAYEAWTLRGETVPSG